MGAAGRREELPDGVRELDEVSREAVMGRQYSKRVAGTSAERLQRYGFVLETDGRYKWERRIV
jgi:hypothetical protein